jgi:hypothetical protein
MMMQVTSDLLPNLPPLSILTVIGGCFVAASLVLYLLSRIPELLLITVISFLYAVVPVVGMIKHM